MNFSLDTDTKNRFKKLFLWGCFTPLAVFIVLILIIFAVRYFGGGNQPPPEYIQAAEKTVEERQKILKKEIQTPSKDYDLDQTVMALYSIEQALADSQNFEDLNKLILQKDNELVAPEIQELKYRFFDIYKHLLEAKDELAESESIYKQTTGTFLDLASTVSYPTMSVDREQARKIWEDRLQKSKMKSDLKQRLSKYQDDLINFYFDFMRLSSSYYKNWEKLCSARDRAYLSIYDGNMNEAVANAAAAVNIAPHEKEAHILLAMSMLERNNETDRGGAEKVIMDYIKEHPGQEAPALLLKGVLEMKKGNIETAHTDFNQSAAYYPKQQEQLQDKLNIYKKRAFLNKSREGMIILNMYKGMMNGSGYFSPDFQMARAYLEANEPEKAKKKIFDHFFRRRLQGEWDKVLLDFQYCNKYLKTDLFKISKGTSIDLSLDAALFTNSIIVNVTNTGKNDIHNLTVLLCVRFTDMIQGDYLSFPVGDTVALLKAGDTASLGRKNINDITRERFGTVKKFKDIIDYAAVVISDEVVCWVDARQIKETNIDDTTDNIIKKASDTADKIQNIIDKTKDTLSSPSKSVN